MEKLSIQVLPENTHEKMTLQMVLAFMGRVLQNLPKTDELNDWIIKGQLKCESDFVHSKLKCKVQPLVHEEIFPTREKASFSDSLWSQTPSHALNEQYYHRNEGDNSVLSDVKIWKMILQDFKAMH